MDILKKLQEYQDKKMRTIPNENKQQVKDSNNPSVVPVATSPSLVNAPTLNTFIKWRIPCELCPSCMARLKGAEPQIYSAFTTIAKGQKVAKKKVKVVKEAEMDGVEEI